MVRKKSMFFQCMHENLCGLPLPERFTVGVFSWNTGFAVTVAIVFHMQNVCPVSVSSSLLVKAEMKSIHSSK